jgi:hypothetical protein
MAWPEARDGSLLLDLAVVGILRRPVSLILSKAFLEPLAAWAGQHGYRWLQGAVLELLGRELPNWPGHRAPAQHGGEAQAAMAKQASASALEASSSLGSNGSDPASS